jgi:hypothetical protein
MHQSNPSNPSSRSILKLKPGTRKSPREAIPASPHEISSAARLPSLRPQRSAIRAPLLTGPDSSPGARRQTANPVASSPRPESKLSQKPGAAWSDELKHRMQKDMDALLVR